MLYWHHTFLAKASIRRTGVPVAERNESGLDFMPATGANLPSVTMNMLIDFLSQNEIWYQPTPTRRVFNWFAAVSHENISCAAPVSIADAHLLFVCGENEAEALLEEKPAAFALVLADKEQTPPPSAAPSTGSPTGSWWYVSKTGSRTSYFSSSRTSRNCSSGRTSSTASWRAMAP
mgnify:CR=1 FL=1